MTWTADGGARASTWTFRRPRITLRDVTRATEEKLENLANTRIVVRCPLVAEKEGGRFPQLVVGSETIEFKKSTKASGASAKNRTRGVFDKHQPPTWQAYALLIWLSLRNGREIARDDLPLQDVQRLRGWEKVNTRESLAERLKRIIGDSEVLAYEGQRAWIRSGVIVEIEGSDDERKAILEWAGVPIREAIGSGPRMDLLSIDSLDELQLSALSQALLAAFPDRSSLNQWVLSGLHQNLEAIVDNGALRNTVLGVLSWAEEQGKLGALLQAAHESAYRNPQLRAQIEAIDRQNRAASRERQRVGVAFADGPTVGWMLECVATEPEVLNFFDLAAFAEAIVLHEQVELLFPRERSEMEEQLYLRATEVLAPLVRGNLIKIVHSQVSEPSTPNTLQATTPLPTSERGVIIEVEKDFTAWFMMRTVEFALAERRNVAGDAIVLPCQSAVYKSNARVRGEHSICRLYLNYTSVRELAQLARQKHQSSGYAAKYGKIPLPPFGHDVFKRCGSLKDLWNVTAEMWAEYAELRRQHHMLHYILDDPDLAPAQKELEERKWRQAWAKLAQKWRARVNPAIANTTSSLNQMQGLRRSGLLDARGRIRVGTSKPHVDAENLQAILTQNQGPWRLRHIHDSLEAYWQVGDRELYGYVEKLLGKPVMTADHELIVKAEEQDMEFSRSAVLVDLFPD